jgi:formyl-CoA transferase
MVLPLEGVKVIETASVIAGPMAGRLLADYGADVIHIEFTARGDAALDTSRPRVGVLDRTIASDIDYASQNHNRNKRGMALDISKESGKKILYRMLETADVFISNFRPSDQAKLQLGYEVIYRINPKLIYANITGFGKEGPDKDIPATEIAGYYARSGILHVMPMSGSHPIGSGDNISGLALAYGIITALFCRERTGIGQQVDASLFQTGVFAISYDIAGALVTNQDRQPIERREIPATLANAYKTQDGRWVQLAMPQAERYWSQFCRAIAREDLENDPRFHDLESRLQNRGILYDFLEQVFKSRTLDEWKTRLNKEGLAWAPVQTLPEVAFDPQARSNSFFTSLDHPNHGRIDVVANPVRLHETPAIVRRPAPLFGQHTEEILLEYGYTSVDILQFRKENAIR